MKSKRKPRAHLTPEQVEKMLAMVDAGAVRAEIAEKFGISEATVYAKMRSRGKAPAKAGRPIGSGRQLTPARLEEMNKDIMAGMPEAEVRKKYKVSQATAYRRAAQVRNPGSNAHGVMPEPEVLLTQEQIARQIEILRKVGEKHPKVFSELRIANKLAQYPMILMEMI